LQKKSQKLIKYFLAALTIPEEELWVNLSPYEKGRIIPKQFGLTQMGKDLLSQDYLLKQLTSSLTSPQQDIGKNFWENAYKKAYHLYGTTEVPINTFNKVWIMPDKAVLYENSDIVYIVNGHLKAMMQEDYLALDKNIEKRPMQADQLDEKSLPDLNHFTASMMEKTILPFIEREINEGSVFSQLRQIYHSLILAIWFKRNLRKHLLDKTYVNKNKIKGIDVNDKQIAEKIYQQYIAAFKKGVYDFIQEDYNPALKQVAPRKYFAGGFFKADELQIEYTQSPDQAILSGEGKLIKVNLFEEIAKKLQGLAEWYSWDEVFDFLYLNRYQPNNSDQERINDVLTLFRKAGIAEEIINEKKEHTYLWAAKESRLRKQDQVLGGILVKQRNNSHLKMILPRANFQPENLTLENLGYFIHELLESTLLEAGVLKTIAHQQALRINAFMATLSSDLSREEGLRLSSVIINQILDDLKNGNLEKGVVSQMHPHFEGIVGAMHQISESHLEKVEELKEGDKNHPRGTSQQDDEWDQYYKELLESNLEQAHNFLISDMEQRTWTNRERLDNARLKYFDALMESNDYSLAFGWLKFLTSRAEMYWKNSRHVENTLREYSIHLIDSVSLIAWTKDIVAYLKILDDSQFGSMRDRDDLWIHFADKLKNERLYSQLYDIMRKIFNTRKWFFQHKFQEFQIEVLKVVTARELDDGIIRYSEEMANRIVENPRIITVLNDVGIIREQIALRKAEMAHKKVEMARLEKLRQLDEENWKLKGIRKARFGSKLKGVLGGVSIPSFQTQTQGNSPLLDNPFINIDDQIPIVDPYGINLLLVYKQAISNLAEDGYILEKSQILVKDVPAKKILGSTQFVVIPELRDEIIKIYKEQLELIGEKALVLNSSYKGQLSFAAESGVAYILQEGSLLFKKKYIVMDEQDYHNFQKADPQHDIWQKFIRKASGNIDKIDPELNKKIFQIVYGGREMHSFSELLDALPDSPRDRGGYYSQMLDTMERMQKELGIAKKTMYDSLPQAVADALKLTRMARLEKFQEDTFPLWSIDSFSDVVKSRFKEAEEKNPNLSIFGDTNLGAPEGWIKELYDIFIWSDVTDKVKALRKLLKKATIPHNQNPDLDNMVAETIAFVKKHGMLPDVSVDDVYLVPADHIIRKANLPALLGSPSGGSYFFLYDNKTDEKLEAFSLSVDINDPLHIVKAFLALAHELTHGRESIGSSEKRPYARPYDSPIMLDSAGSHSMDYVFNEGAAVHFTNHIALPLLSTKTPGITMVKGVMLKKYKEENADDADMQSATVNHLTKNQINQLYYWFLEHHSVGPDYQQRNKMVKIMDAKYGKSVMENFFFKKDFDPFTKAIGHLLPFINILILTRSNYSASQIEGIKNEFWDSYAFTLVEHLISKPYYDELDFFIDLLGLLGRDAGTNRQIENTWLYLQGISWKGTPSDMFKESATRRYFVRQEVLGALMRDLGGYLKKTEQADNAMSANATNRAKTPTGGIDLDSAGLEFQKQGPGTGAMEFSFPIITNPCFEEDGQICDQPNFQDFEILPVQGLRPAIFAIEPIINLPIILGASAEEEMQLTYH